MEKTPVYCDYNATTPVAPEVRSAMEPFLTGSFANPSSLHQAGKESAKAIRQARRAIAKFFQIEEEHEILFTSGGTESNNTAVRSALRTTGKKRIVTTSVEHSSIRKLAQQLIKEGYEIHELPVDSEGRLDLEILKDSLTEDTALVSVMLANNETGVLFPAAEIGKIARAAGILFHVDAVQAAGKFPLFIKSLGADFVSVSAHKFYGPKGTGFLYVRKDTPFYPLIMGGGQERGRRAGTENCAGIAGMAAACELAASDFQGEMSRQAALRDSFESRVLREIPGVEVSGAGAPRIPNTSNLRFPGMDGESLLIALDENGIFASNGSACLSGSPEPSHVLKAMGFSDEEASSAIRFSFGRYTTEEEMRKVMTVLTQTVERMRKFRETLSRR
jgi:cysteine desulfurase